MPYLFLTINQIMLRLFMYCMFLRLIKIYLGIAQLLQKGYKVSFEHEPFVIKDSNNLEVFKVYLEDKNFASLISYRFLWTKMLNFFLYTKSLL